MICPHLQSLEQAIIASGAHEVFRGKTWSLNCREWVYFDCYIDTETVIRTLPLPDCVKVHIHRGTHDGQERGFVCSDCNDAIMGIYEPRPDALIFRGVENQK
jgi:hypothetical protein